MNRHLEIGDTFTTEGGLVMEVLTRHGNEFECIHRATNWRGIYALDGEFLRAAAGPDHNLHADFYDEKKA